MSGDDVRRWAEGGAPGDLSELIKSAREADPSAEQIANLSERLGPIFNAPPGTPVAPPDAAAAQSGAAGGAGLKLAGGLIIAALVGGGIWLARPNAPATEDEPARALPAVEDRADPASALPTQPAAPADDTPDESTPSPDEASPAPSPAGQAQAPAAPATQPQGRTQAANKPSASKPSEAALLRQAQAALKSNPKHALALTRQHQALYPNGALAQEREVIAIEALSKLGKAEQAKERAGDFGSKYPKSAHQKKVETTVSE